ncbi:MAG: hypothetical protein FWH54_04500 [Methanobrevibacter sp.]|nr:hypothetical protein [Methanobrevibacter sp.]MCL2157265.1 hypothetical protein [Methanobrevibacter sp.]
MKTLILCDRESSSYDNVDLSSEIQTTVKKSNYKAKIIEVNGDEIKPCIGCFGCWFKTPGLCVMREDSPNEIARKEIQSDVLLLVSKFSYGGFSYDIKSFLDRSIPNISPFFETVDGEIHHKMRYDRFPIMISIGYGAYSSEENQTFINLAKRNALNMQAPKHFVFIIDSVDEIDINLKSLENVLNFEVPKCLRQ